MGRYIGEATMLIDGVPYPVHAVLEGHFESEETQSFGGKNQVPGLPVWGGTLQTDAQDLTWTTHNAEELILRAERSVNSPTSPATTSPMSPTPPSKASTASTPTPDCHGHSSPIPA
ncbi:hypothetical protein ACGFXB_44390 [Streptomyces canus]|uniref:hypothetical protein n=1 Tax=Streptomyces canus TaxID=58343 RepID=UPI003714956D